MIRKLVLGTALAVLSLTALAPSAAVALDTDFLFSWGSLGAGDGQFNQPVSIAIGPGGEVYVVDRVNGRVQKFDADGNFLTKWGISSPPIRSVTVIPDGTVFVAASTYLYKFAPDGAPLGALALAFTEVLHLTSDASSAIYCTLGSRLAGTCTYRTDSDLGPMGSVYCSYFGYSHSGTVIGSDGSVFVTESSSISKRTNVGASIWQIPSTEVELGIDALDNVYGTNPNDDMIRVYDKDGTFLTEFGGTGSLPGRFHTPEDVAVGIDGRIYVVDGNNHRIQVFGNGTVPVRDASWGRLKAHYRGGETSHP